MGEKINIGNKSYILTSDDNYLDAMGAEFEPRMVQLFNILVKPNDVVVDVGGNIGLTAILFSELGKKVYVFEPSPSTFKILKENILRAKTHNVETINLGLGERSENLTITFSNNNRSGGFVSNTTKLGGGHVTEDIQIDTLDNFFSQNDHPINFIKIDVEGFEGKVIGGGLNIIKKNKPIVTLEMNHFCLNVLHRITIPEFLDFLRSVFPFLYAVDTDNATICDLHDVDQAYFVMHEHLLHFRFPNIVGGFNPTLKATLKKLESSVKTEIAERNASTPDVTDTNGSLHVVTQLKSVNCYENFSIDVEISNKSTCVWSVNGSNPVRLSYHWLDKKRNTIIFEGNRSTIKNDDIQPGQIVNAKLNIVAPPNNGDCSLVVTLVQENVCWFESKGFTPDEIAVIVN